jgi:hypothetical protein
MFVFIIPSCIFSTHARRGLFASIYPAALNLFPEKKIVDKKQYRFASRVMNAASSVLKIRITMTARLKLKQLHEFSPASKNTHYNLKTQHILTVSQKVREPSFCHFECSEKSLHSRGISRCDASQY